VKHVLLVNTSCEPVVRLLEQRTDVRLSVITSRSYTRFYRQDTDVVPVDDVEDLTQVRLAALEIRRRNAFEHVVSPSELSLQAGGYLRSYFGLAGPGYEVSNAFSNKHVMKQWLRAAGLPVARFRQVSRLADVTDAAAELGWPVVVKPAIGGGAEDVFVVRDEPGLGRLAESPTSASLRRSPYPILVEQFLDITEEFHCDGIVCDGEVRAASVAKYFAPVLASVGKVVGSYTLPDDEPDAMRIADIHEKVVKAFGLADGVTHLEVLKVGGDLVVGEVTHRPGGGGIPELLHHQFGVDIFEALVNLSIGDGFPRTPPPAGDYLVQYMLPRPPGRVRSISSAAELAALPGVERVDIRQQPGDEQHDVVHSATFAGVVLIRAETEAQARERIDLVGRTYRIDVTAGGDHESS
jgi:biotin carboxylase